MTSPKQENFRQDKCDIRVSTNSCDAARKREAVKKNLNEFFVQNTRYNAFIIVIPGFSESEIGIGNNIQDISSDILGISNRKKQYIRYIKNI